MSTGEFPEVSWHVSGEKYQFSRVVAGAKDSCALKVDERGLACFGTDLAQNEVSQIVRGVSISSAVSGKAHLCGLDSTGKVVCRGNNEHLQSDPLTGSFVEVAAGEGHTCGRRIDNSVECWGDDSVGQGTPNPGTYKAIGAGYEFTCGLRTNDTITCWGQFTGPVPSGTFTHLTVGHRHACAWHEEGGEPKCWGENIRGEATIDPGSVKSISAGHQITCWIDKSGLPECAGGEEEYFEFNPAHDIDVTFREIAVGTEHVCALNDRNRVFCWGLCDDEEIGGRCSPP